MTLSEFFVRFIVALIVGGMMGLEREAIGKKAGIRTIMLVCSGAALYSMISVLIPEISGNMYEESMAVSIDASRIISNIVVGIGFIGAGVIIQERGGEVHGLTTAALIWVAAAIGVIIGLGMLLEGVIIGAVVSLTLFSLRNLSIKVSEKDEAKK